MDRCAIFIDAGYVFAEGGKLCHGTPARHRLRLDVAGIVGALCEIAGGACGLPVLRSYWYDGARGGVPSPSQQAIAALPNTKLRLGRLNTKNQQKGVDALIYRDLMTLARERAISEAFLVAGDEDLREGVRAAQDMGVRVTVVGIVPANQGFNQSRELVTEADMVVQLTRDQLIKFVHQVARQSATISPLVQPNTSKREAVAATATAFAKEWWAKASESDQASLLAGRPRIPTPLDVELVQCVEDAHKLSLRGNDQVRREIRRAFWEAATGASQTQQAFDGD